MEAKKVYNSLLSMNSASFVKFKGRYVVEYVMHTNNNKDALERTEKANQFLGVQ